MAHKDDVNTQNSQSDDLKNLNGDVQKKDKNPTNAHSSIQQDKQAPTLLSLNDSSNDNNQFFDYSSIRDILNKNEVQFPPNPVRINEMQILATIMAEPVHNNALLIVDKIEDALPLLSLFESLYQLIGKQQIPFVLVHPSNFINSSENISFSEDITKGKGILTQFIEDVQNHKCVPILTDIISFLELEELANEVDQLLSQPQSVICIVTKKQRDELNKIIDEEKEYQRSFASSKTIMPKTPFSSFTHLELLPLSFQETRAIFKSYTKLLLKPSGLFSKQAIDSVLQKGYALFPDNNKLLEIQNAFRMLSVIEKINGVKKITPQTVYEFFKKFETQYTRDPILECENILNQKVLGQTGAIHQISELIQSKKFALIEEKQPTVMGFFGPSGVGKTATAEELGPILSGQKSILINMSEFQESHSISKLISSPPGYIGSDQAGLLYKTISQNPQAVFILDEFEKANETVHKLFLGIFDKGTAHDTAAGDVDLSQATFILTSNAGIKETAGLGFDENSGKISYEADEKAIENAFSPEFMGRLQARILFKPLSEDVLSQIIDLTLKPAQEKLNNQFGVQLSLTDSSRTQLIKEGSRPRYGARPLKNLIKTKILTPLTIQLHQNKLSPKSNILVSFDTTQNKYIFKTTSKSLKKQYIQVLPNQSKTRE